MCERVSKVRKREGKRVRKREVFIDRGLHRERSIYRELHREIYI